MIVRQLSRRLPLAIALVFFAVGVTISAHSLTGQIAGTDFGILAMTFVVTVPITLTLTPLRFRLISAEVGTPIPIIQCLYIVIVATAANFLPIPGGFLVRVNALRRHGVRRSLYVNVLATLVWFTVSSAFAWLASSRVDSRYLEILFSITTLGGLLITTAGWYWRGHRWPRLPTLFLIQAAISLVDIVRLWLIGHAIQVSLGLDAAAIIGFSGVVGTMSGLLPAGIGITESIGAGLATTIGIGASAGFLLTAINRILLWGGITPLAIVLLRHPGMVAPSHE
ncbi:MAG: hypothetical protein PVI37_00170 [Gammaproteobacteria bacterium]